MAEATATIYSRIRKLMALANDSGATEAEARLAAEKAQELMTEYNLTTAALEASGGSGGDDAKRTDTHVQHRQVYKWQRRLMDSLAKLNFCDCQEMWREERSRETTRSIFNGYSLIGRASNVASCTVMFEYLVKTIDRLATDAVDGDGTRKFTKFAASFREGCADRLMDRLDEKRADKIREQEQAKKEAETRARHPGAATSNAMTVWLGDYVQDENDLNRDHKYNLAPGTTRQVREKREQEHEAWRQKAAATYAAKEAKLRAQYADIDEQVLWWMMHMDYGYCEALAKVAEANKPARPETARQREKREQQYENWSRRESNRQYRESARLDPTGYSLGRKAGDKVGLSPQMDNDKKHRLR